MSSIGRALGVLRAGTQLLRRGPQRIMTRKASGGPHIEPQLSCSAGPCGSGFCGTAGMIRTRSWVISHGLMHLNGQMKSLESHQMMKNEIICQ
ncbi:hypothetical protein LDENG_00004870 [Lucifuga dentata]|nr:hypothetical protein LDENG_00004870 [Lucifuga dentata]